MASCCIPICKPLNSDFLILKIKINLAPFAAAVYPIPVGCGGIFVFCLLQFFKTQIHDTARTVFDQLRGQPIQCSVVGDLCTFFGGSVHNSFPDFLELEVLFL